MPEYVSELDELERADMLRQNKLRTERRQTMLTPAETAKLWLFMETPEFVKYCAETKQRATESTAIRYAVLQIIDRGE